MNRRQFLGLDLGTSLISGIRPGLWLAPGEVFGLQSDSAAIQLGKPHRYQSLFRHVSPGHDEFPLEKTVFEITAHLKQLVRRRSLPQAEGFRGVSPAPARYWTVAPDVREAVFDPANPDFPQGLERWLEGLGKVRESRFFVTDIRPDGPDTARIEVRYEISAEVKVGSNRLVAVLSTISNSGVTLRRQATGS